MDLGMGSVEDLDPFEGVPPSASRPYFCEKEIRLSDVWEGNGKARKSVVRDGKVVSLYYLYDFGVSVRINCIDKIQADFVHRTIGIIELIFYPLV